MSAAKIPAASAIAASDVAPLAPLTVDEILEHLKDRTADELWKILETVTKLTKKASKSAPSKGTRKGTKKGSAVPLSPEEQALADQRGEQLAKPRAWMAFVEADARANGWPTFPVKKTTKDSITKKVVSTEIVWMPASLEEQVNGEYVFPPVADKKGVMTSAKFNGKNAMSLSTFYWGPAPKKGEERTTTEYGRQLREKFEEEYPAIAAAAAAKKAAAPASASDAEEEAEEDAEPEAVAEPVKPKVATKKPVAKKQKPAEPEPKAAEPKAAEPKPKKADAWKPRADGKFSPWTYRGRPVRRNKDNYVVGKDENGEDDWLGQYDEETDTINECDIPDDFAM